MFRPLGPIALRGYHMQEFGLCTSSSSYLTFFSKVHTPVLAVVTKHWQLMLHHILDKIFGPGYSVCFYIQILVPTLSAD